MLWTNLLVAFFNFLVLGRPVPRKLKSTETWATRTLFLVQAEVARRLLQDTVRHVSSSGGAISSRTHLVKISFVGFRQNS